MYAPLEQQAKDEGGAGRSDVEQPPPTMAAVSAGDALRHSFTVGLSGGGATVFSVATMMWLHTIITYQQRHGTSFGDTCKVRSAGCVCAPTDGCLLVAAVRRETAPAAAFLTLTAIENTQEGVLLEAASVECFPGLLVSCMRSLCVSSGTQKYRTCQRSCCDQGYARARVFR